MAGGTTAAELYPAVWVDKVLPGDTSGVCPVQLIAYLTSAH
jgi:hypothetical protein